MLKKENNKIYMHVHCMLNAVKAECIRLLLLLKCEIFTECNWPTKVQWGCPIGAVALSMATRPEY